MIESSTTPDLREPPEPVVTQDSGRERTVKPRASILPRKVLIYAMNFTPELIGCGRYTGEIADALQADGIETEVVTTPPHYPGWAPRDGYSARRYVTETRPGLRITRCPVGLSRNMRGLGRIWAPVSFALSSAPIVVWRILRFRPSHVLCIEPTLMAAPMALLGARLVGARTTLHVQDLEIDAAFAVGHVKGGWVRGLAKLFEQWVTTAFDRVVTISDKMGERLRAKKVRADRLGIVRNWVDVSRVYPLNTVSTFRAELGLGVQDFVALYAGNIGVKQALHLVTDAARALKDDSRIRFVIAGDGPEKTALVACGLPNVLFLPLQPENRLNDLLNLADVHLLPQDKGVADLVLPSKIGGMLASGKAILAMADEGTEVHSFLSGYAEIVNTGDVAGMVQTLVRLCGAPPLGDAQVEAQRQARLDQLSPHDLIRRIFGSSTAITVASET